MNRFSPLLIFSFAVATAAIGQVRAGLWEGILRQDGNAESYRYQLRLTVDGEEIYGQSSSQAEGGGVRAEFEVGGLWDGATLTLQEVQQRQPDPSKPENRWCLKHIRLSPSVKNDTLWLTGTWQSQGCEPGTLTLWQPAASGLVTRSVEELPLPGKWIGYLSQTDRSDDFFFEMELLADGSGSSRIISDTEGGNAQMLLQWKYDPDEEVLFFEEKEIQERSIPGWRWCIKRARLQLGRPPGRRSFSGAWEGVLTDPPPGPCAPGAIYVERPLPEPPTPDQPTAPSAHETYTKDTQRPVEVQRVLEVQRKEVQIRVWDNGVVDGDIVTLFLNDKQIVKNYRVTRNKLSIPVTLDEATNYIILHAINTGSISPNTVAVSVDDGRAEQIVILSSNLRNSGAIMVREFVVK